MKPYCLLLLLGLFQACGRALAAEGDLTGFPASVAETVAGTDRTKWVTPYDLANAGVGSNTNALSAAQAAILANAVTNGSAAALVPDLTQANFFWDMNKATNTTGLAQLAITSGGSDPHFGFGLWASSVVGYGTNVWGRNLSIPGGLATVGNNVWTNLTQSPFDIQNTHFYMGYGPAASSKAVAWPNGLGGSSVQPGYYFDNANPWSGYSYISIRCGMTNSARGSFLGNDADGVPVYMNQFGVTMGIISDAYFPTNKEVGGKAESQQSPGMVTILNDPALSYFWVQNGGHVNTSTNAIDTKVLVGQVPSLVLDTTTKNSPGWPIVRIPYQKADVWMPRNPAWEDTLTADTVTGTVTIPRVLLVGSTNAGSAFVVSNSVLYGNGSGLSNVTATLPAGVVTNGTSTITFSGTSGLTNPVAISADSAGIYLGTNWVVLANGGAADGAFGLVNGKFSVTQNGTVTATAFNGNGISLTNAGCYVDVQTPSGGVILFTNINQSFTRLTISLSLRGDATNNASASTIQFNADTSAHYCYSLYYGAAISDGASTAANSASAIIIMVANNASSASGTVSEYNLSLPNYSATNNVKGVQSSGQYYNAGIVISYGTGQWSSTNAITSIRIAPASGNFASGSKATLIAQ